MNADKARIQEEEHQDDSSDSTAEVHEKRNDIESDEPPINPNLPFPKSIFLIVSNEFCERFSYYGMRTILALYLTDALGYSEALALTIYHAWVAMCYFTPVIGAILADSFLGKFRTIFYISIIYAIGQLVLTFGSYSESGSTMAFAMSFLGLALIAFGTGGIKPCVVSFGAEQFKLPDQAARMSSYFGLFYASINAGSLLSTFLTPMLRTIECLDKETCFPLAFGVPALLMIVAILVFLAGRMCNLYKMTMPEENIIVKFFSCIWTSFKESRKHKSKNSDADMLDYGAAKFGKAFVSDTRAVLNVLYMFIPFPIFWALFDQQGSLWIFQARNMNGLLWGDKALLPDQVQLVNPFLILALIPVFEYGVYPLFQKCGMLKTPLQKIVTGGTLAGVSFVITGILELQLRNFYAVEVGSGEMHVTIYNGLPQGCVLPEIHLANANDKFENVAFNFADLEDDEFYILKVIEKNEDAYSIPTFEVKCDLGAKGKKTIKYSVPQEASQWLPEPYNPTFKFERDIFTEEDENIPNGVSILLTYDIDTWSGDETVDGIVFYGDDIPPLKKTADTFPDAKMIWHTKEPFTGDFIIDGEIMPTNRTSFMSRIGDSETVHMKDSINEVEVNNTETGKIVENPKFEFGANYVFLYLEHGGDLEPEFKTHSITPSNEVHMFWIIPQYFVMTCGEVMFSITGLEFAFSQAPDTMRAVLQSAFTVTTGLGNILVVLIEATLSEVLEKEELAFLFAGLMFVDMLLLAWMASRYKYVDYTTAEKKK